VLTLAGDTAGTLDFRNSANRLHFSTWLG
jgi:hypothetical protein